MYENNNNDLDLNHKVELFSRKYNLKININNQVPYLACYDRYGGEISINLELLKHYTPLINIYGISTSRIIEALIYHEYMHKILHERESSKILATYYDVEASRRNVEIILEEIEHYIILKETSYRDVEYVLYRLWINDVVNNFFKINYHYDIMMILLRLAYGLALGFIHTEEIPKPYKSKLLYKLAIFFSKIDKTTIQDMFEKIIDILTSEELYIITMKLIETDHQDK